MRKFTIFWSLALVIILFGSTPIVAQVGIGTTTPKAQLDIVASNPVTPTNTDGILIPRVDALPTTSPTADQNGMLVFLTTDKTFYYWDHGNTAWVAVNNPSGYVQKIDDLSDGKSDSDGSQNGSSVFLGVNAGAADDSSNNANVGVGFETLKSNTIGIENAAFGYQALHTNIGGQWNTASGFQSLFSNSTGSKNTAYGYESMKSNSTGIENVAIGYRSGYTSTGDGNVFIGRQAGYTSTGNGNVFIGRQAGYLETGSNKLYIENSNANSSNALIYGDFDSNVLKINAKVGVGALTPLSTLDVNGNLSLKVVSLNGGPAASRTPIVDGIYLKLRPSSGSDEFIVENATSVPGRYYIIRNVTSHTNAKIYSNGGWFYPANSESGYSGPLIMPFNATLKTLILISDGANWTYFGFY